MSRIRHSDKGLKNHKESLEHKPVQRLGRRGSRYKKKRVNRSRKRQRIRLAVLLLLFFFASAVTVYLMHEHYELYPGHVERDSIHLMGRGTDYLVITWSRARNVKDYKVYYKEYTKADSMQAATDGQVIDDSWEERSTAGNIMMFSDLKEGSQYAFVIRGDSADREGEFTKVRNFSTKRTQKLKVSKKIMRFSSSKPFKIKAEAMTDLNFKSSDTSVAKVDRKTGKVTLKGAGVTHITVEARETGLFGGDKEVVELEVIEANPVKAGGAKAVSIYHLNPDNCEIVKEVSGADGHVVPQSFGYTGDKYILAYGMSGQGRIVTYPVDGSGEEGKEVIVPSLELSHPNGFTYADENKTCYSVKGWSSRAVTYDTKSGKFGAISLRYGCSGIGYDRKEKKLYTSSRTLMASYDISDGYSVVSTCGVVSHSGTMATQDIGGHGGIMLRCLSPNGNKHSTNWIDLYDMRNGTYLGSITCDLSEVESAIVNKDGYLEILANNSGNTDYIWRTPLNIDQLARGLD